MSKEYTLIAVSREKPSFRHFFFCRHGRPSLYLFLWRGQFCNCWYCRPGNCKLLYYRDVIWWCAMRKFFHLPLLIVNQIHLLSSRQSWPMSASKTQQLNKLTHNSNHEETMQINRKPHATYRFHVHYRQ